MKFVEVFPRGTRGLTPFADSNVKFSGMIAVHLEKRRVEVRNVRRPRRTQGFALMRLLCGGICNTDLELQRGYSGFSGTPGHEFVGEVVEADNADLRGRRVVGEI